jgi:protein-tyrosine phosphatase
MRQIESYSLWVGHAGDVADLQALFAAGIAVVIDLAGNEPPAVLPRDRVYCRFPLIDGTGNPVWLLRAAVNTVTCFLRSNTPTLVACSAGLSRSPCIAAAAIAIVRECPLDEGLAFVLQSGRADVSPAFWSELRAACGKLGDGTS